MKKWIGLLVICLFGTISIVDLLHPGFALTHDGQDHIARIANFYLNLSQGIVIPRWAPNLNYGYGHPILEFLYPLPSYIASFFHMIGFSLIDSTKLVFALSMIASGIAMWLFTRTLWGEKAGIVSGILYMYAPYRFIDLYVRGDIGEHIAFVFIPLVFLGLYLLSKNQSVKNVLFASVALAFLILSHNAIALMVVPLIFLYTLFLVWQGKWQKKQILSFGLFFLFGFLFSSFFWVPALLEGQYTLRNIVTKGGYITRFVTFPKLLYGPWSYGQSGEFSVQLGILHIFSFFGGIILTILLWRKNKAVAVFLGGLILYTIAAIFLMLPVSNGIWAHVMMLQNFQFPWRFLAIPVFTLSLIGGFCVSQIRGRNGIIIVILICCILLLLSKDYIHAKSYEQKPESFFTGIYKTTTDTGESSPIWSVRFMEHGFGSPLQVISGKATIAEEKRLPTRHAYVVSSIGTTRLLENTLYFPGWKITVDNKPVVIQFQDPQYRGLMTFSVVDGTHTVVVAYGESKLRILGDILSLMGIIGMIGLYFFSKYKKVL